METKVSKWGNSLAVRLPKYVVETLGLADNELVEVRVGQDNNEIILRTKKGGSRLEDLVEKISDENRHQLITTSEPKGLEVW